MAAAVEMRQQLPHHAARHGHATFRRRQPGAGEMQEDGAAAAASPRPDVPVEHQADIVEVVVAPHPLMTGAIGQPDRSVVVAVVGYLRLQTWVEPMYRLGPGAEHSAGCSFNVDRRIDDLVAAHQAAVESKDGQYRLLLQIAQDPTSAGRVRPDTKDIRDPHPTPNGERHPTRTLPPVIKAATAIVQLLQAQHADVILTGHDHNYQRFPKTGGVREFVVGTGGAGLYSFVSSTSAGLRPEKRLKTHGALMLTLNPGGYAWTFKATGGATQDSGSTTCG